jgi:endonuclease III
MPIKPKLSRRESTEARADRVARIAARLQEAYPDATCELDYRNAWQLLVATILSAQCTDKMVNQVTPALFEQFPDAESLAQGRPSKIEGLIRKTGFYRQKAKAIHSSAKDIVDRFGSAVPDTIEGLTSLQGVGRKTASVVLGTAFGKPAVFVDTHVKRLSRRLAITRSEDPDKIEQDIRRLLPPQQWTEFCHRLIHHGRRICFARRPNCPGCPLEPLCPRVGVAVPR